jgi:hypothetical protein
MMNTPKPQRPAHSDKKWWKQETIDQSKDCAAEPREGHPCPACLLGELHFNGLFQLICDNCGRVAEAAVFT